MEGVGVSLVGFVLGLLGLVGAFNAFVIPAEPFRPGGRKDTGIRTLREVSWLVVLLALAVCVGGGTAIYQGLGRMETTKASHERAVKNYEDALAARDRESTRAEKVIVTSVKRQYRVEEVRTDGWSWKDARKAVTPSKMDSPAIEVLTEDGRRGRVLVKYDNRSGDASLITDVRSGRTDSGIDATSLRRDQKRAGSR